MTEPAKTVVAISTDVVAGKVQATEASTGLITFNARGSTWVQVVDAKGVVQLSKTLASGESASTRGVSPLTVVVGRADVTTVEVHGKVFDLTSVVKDNVARFEVK